MYRLSVARVYLSRVAKTSRTLLSRDPCAGTVCAPENLVLDALSTYISIRFRIALGLREQ